MEVMGVKDIMDCGWGSSRLGGCGGQQTSTLPFMSHP